MTRQKWCIVQLKKEIPRAIQHNVSPDRHGQSLNADILSSRGIGVNSKSAAEETEERVELTPVVAEDAVIKYSVSKSSDFTSFIEDCLEGDTSDEAQARRQKSRDEIEAALAHIVRKDTQLTYGKTLNRDSVKKPIKELVFGLMLE